MATGLTQVIACPHCESVAVNASVLTEESAFHTIWTDGKTENAVPIPRSPSFVRCAHCRGFFWPQESHVKCRIDVPPDHSEVVIEFTDRGTIRKAEIGELESILPPEWIHADCLRFPTAADYQDALAETARRTVYAEVFLRTQWWWSVNDAVRGTTDSESPALCSHDHALNLERLMDSLPGDSGNERITKAEIHRELGELDEAVALLTRVPSEVAESARRIRRLALEGSTRVEVLYGPDRGIRP